MKFDAKTIVLTLTLILSALQNGGIVPAAIPASSPTAAPALVAPIPCPAP